jgi:hypothetical protein
MCRLRAFVVHFFAYFPGHRRLAHKCPSTGEGGIMDVIGEVLRGTAEQFVGWVEQAGPKLLAAVIILIVGWTVAKLVKIGLVKFLKIIKVDTLAEKVGVDRFLKRGNIQSNSVEVVGTLIYWLLLLLSLLVAVKAMGISEAQVIFSGVVAIIPRVIAAVVILVLGLSFSGFISDVVQTAAVNAQVREARLLANVSRWAIVTFVAIMALDQLAIATDVISQALLILFGAICLALSLAFGLGCRDLAGRVAQGWWDKEKAESNALNAASDDAD